MSSDHFHFNVIPDSFNKVIKVPSSKSYANRLLVLAAISKDDILVENLPPSTDVSIMIDSLSKIGLSIELKDDSVWVRGSFPECEVEGPHVLKTGDGGTTNRFLCGLLARGKEKYIIEPSGHMLDRPMWPLLKALKSMDVKVSYRQEDEWITIQGPFKKSSQVEVDAGETTQFLTSLALSLSDSRTQVVPHNLKVSLPYWGLTQKLIKEFNDRTLSFFNPVDFSSLTYPLALAAVKGSVTVSNCLHMDEAQADSIFIELLKRVGAKVKWSKEGLTVTKGDLRPIEVDGSQFPDSVPTLMFVCAFCSGVSRITNLEVLTHKECNRFSEMIRMLKAFGVRVVVDERKYEISIEGPVESRVGIDYDPPEDHRMVMVAYLFQRSLAGGKLSQINHVAKSFGGFFKIME